MVSMRFCEFSYDEYGNQENDSVDFFDFEFSDGWMGKEKGVSVLHLATFSNSFNFIIRLLEVLNFYKTSTNVAGRPKN